MNFGPTHLYNHIVYKKKQQLLLTPLKNLLVGFFRNKFFRWRSRDICIKKIDSSGAKLLEHSAKSIGNCVCGLKVEAIPS